MNINYGDWLEATRKSYGDDPTECNEEDNFYCEECFEENLGDDYVEQEDGTILCYGCDSKRLIKEQ